MKAIQKNKKQTVLFTIIAMAILSSGCSVVGLGVGAVIDNSPGKLSKCECGIIKAGTKATINLRDGSAVDGEYTGLENKPDEEYLDEYDDFREKNRSRIYLPEIGDTLIIATVDGNRGRHRFEGFDYIRDISTEQLEQGPILSCLSISARELRSLKKREYTLNNLYSISCQNERYVTGKDLRSLCSSAALPLKSELSLISDGRPRHINLDEIESIEAHEKRYAKWICLGIGAVIDACIIAIGISFSESMNNLGSCSLY